MFEPSPTHSFVEPAHAGGLGNAVVWACRIVLGAALAALVRMAVLSAALPSCGPGPKPERWPTLLPALVIAALVAGGAGWLVGRLKRLDSAASFFFAVVGVMMVALFALGIVLLAMSFMTVC
jgi:peptidoglycan biosynthesis protein MviN/MurJ (putative lipid II flippase)